MCVCVCVCVCVYEIDRERVCVCMRERESMCVYERERREREREKVCVCERERGSESVCVCVYERESVCVCVCLFAHQLSTLPALIPSDPPRLQAYGCDNALIFWSPEHFDGEHKPPWRLRGSEGVSKALSRAPEVALNTQGASSLRDETAERGRELII